MLNSLKNMLLAGFFFVFFLSLPLWGFGKAYAFTVKTGDSVMMAEDEVTEDSVFASGKSIDIKGHIMGDLICVGQTVMIDAVVDGDVLCAGQTVRIAGEIGGNIRSAGQDVTVSGGVERNATILGQTIMIGSMADIGMDAFLVGKTLTLDGSIARDLTAMADTAQLNGSVTRNADVNAKNVIVGPGAQIFGNLNYTSPNKAQISDSSSVSGTVMFTERKVEEPKKPQPAVKPAMRIGWGSMIFYLIIGLIMVALFPGFMGRTVQAMSGKPWVSLGIGFATLILLPFVIITLILTLIGIPIAFFVIMIAVMVLILAKLFPAVFVGTWIYRQLVKKGTGKFQPVIIGVPVTILLFSLPWIGPLLSFAAVCAGTGAFILSLKSMKTAK